MFKREPKAGLAIFRGNDVVAGFHQGAFVADAQQAAIVDDQNFHTGP
jgi:hypothetical protein